MKIKCRDTGEVVTNYAEYLQTAHWQMIRRQAQLKSNGVCQCCHQPLYTKFIAHHTTTEAYERIGHERMNTPVPKLLKTLLSWFGFHKDFYMDDVIAVCPHCHNGDSDEHKTLHQNIDVPKWAKRD